MTEYRIKEAARLLGVSDDTVRRWIDSTKLKADRDASGRAVVDGAELVDYLQRTTDADTDQLGHGTSARNRFPGIVTGLVVDTVMAQVELRCGPHRVISLMSSEAVRELGLHIGARATAVVKATTVIVETEGQA